MNREEATKLAETGLAELAQALEQGKSETLVKYLDLLSRFHHYSFRNCLLIAIQRPDATQVAGFNRWKELGRFVKKGEHGIAILAPLVYKKKAEDEVAPEEAEDGNVRTLRGFKVVHVFDVTQTEGQELPEFAQTGGDPGEALSRLEAYVQTYGITLRYDQIPGGALGVSKGGEIIIQPGMTPAQTFCTLVHELAHELLHKGERRKQTTKTVKETEAEAVAFVVARAMGLQTSTTSSDYIQLYAGDKDVLNESLELIQTLAAEIVEALQAKSTEEVPHAA